MCERFDVVVLGFGTAASIIATQCQTANWQVAVVDRRTFGGTYALRGCTPKKVLAHATAVIDAVNCMRDKGINLRPMGITWSSLMDFRHAFTNNAPTNTEHAFARQNIAC
jgi:glutathione reductase (NADPH)